MAVSNNRYLKCPKCGGRMSKVDSVEQSRSCFNCGYSLRGTHQQHQFIQINAREIAEYWVAHGTNKTAAAYRISTTAIYRIPLVRDHILVLQEASNKAKDRVDHREMAYKQASLGTRVDGAIPDSQVGKLVTFYKAKYAANDQDILAYQTYRGLEELLRLRVDGNGEEDVKEGDVKNE